MTRAASIIPFGIPFGLSFVIAATLALTACSPYDPSLPSTPFLCGATEPRCPDGYACVTEDKQLVCHADGEPLPDAGVPDAP